MVPLGRVSVRQVCPPFCCVLILAVVTSACGSTSTESVVGPGGPKCSVALTAPAAIDAGGGTASVAVSTQPECEWTASAESGWITDVTPAQGQGNGTVQFQVAPNPTATARDSAIAINGQRAAVRQSAAACQFSAAANVNSFPAAGGTGTVAISAPGGCAWTTAASASWITPSPRSGSGSGSFSFTVARNSGAERSGVITVAEVALTISQESASAPAPSPTPTPSPTPAPSPCTVTLQPTSASVAAAGGSGSFAVTVGAGCQWTASEQATWLTLSTPSGVGNGSVGYTAAANTGAARSAIVNVAGTTFTLSQPAPAACAPSINPSSITVGDEDIDALTVAVTAAATCAWTATSNAGWLQIKNGSAGIGNGTVTYDVSKGSSRTGTMTIAGQTFTVTQVKCSATLDPTAQDVPAAGGSFTVSVTTQVGCGWQAIESLNWVTVTNGSSGMGSGTVTYTVSPNTGHGDRKGNMAIAGRNLAIDQAGAP